MTSRKQDAAVLNWIQENQVHLIALLQDLVRIPSVTGEELTVQERIHRELERMHLRPEMYYPDVEKLSEHEIFFETPSFLEHGYENRPNVAGLIRGKGGGRLLCLSSHVDAVSPELLDHMSSASDIVHCFHGYSAFAQHQSIIVPLVVHT